MGHPTGDAVIRYTGECVRKSLRITDQIARIGGDELAGFLVNPDIDHLEDFKKRIEQNLIENKDRLLELLPDPKNFDSVLNKIGISIGFANIEKNDSYDTLYQRADAELYKVKNE